MITRLNSWPARAPAQRFADVLTGARAWLGAIVGRYPFDVELFHLLLRAGLPRRTGLSLIPYSPLANGLLTGKYRRGQPAPEGTRLASSPRGAEALNDRSFDLVEAIERFATQRGITPVAVALGWLAAQPEVASVIAGATSGEQVVANAAATAWEPTEEDLAELDLITGSNRTT